MYNYGYDYSYDYGYADVDAAVGILGGFALMGLIMVIISMVLSVLMIVSQWKIYKKAGKNGWEVLIPVYNIIVLLQIVELPMWYIALFFVPFANIYAMFKIYIELAHKFGKSTGFGVLTAFFSVICLPILAFGKNSVYNGAGTTNNQSNNVNMQNVPYTPNNMNTFQNANPNMESSSNIQQPFVFNQNVNTEINPIPTVQNDFNNPVEPMDTSVQPIIPETNNFGTNVENSNPQPMNIPNLNNQAPVQPSVQQPFSNVNPTVEPTNEATPLNVMPGVGQTIGSEMPNPNNNNNQMM